MKYKTILLAGLSGIFLSAQTALAIETPPGWEMKKDEDGVKYTPKDERFVYVYIGNPESDDEKTPLEMIEENFKYLGRPISQSSSPDQTGRKGDRAEAVMEVPGSGEMKFLQMVIYQVSDSQIRAIQFMGPDKDGLQERYQKAVDDMISAQYMEDMLGKQ